MRALNRYIALLMLIGMLLQTNCVLIYYGLFALNQKAIAERLCEKRTEDCCGHCFLQKQINTATDTEAASTEKQTPPKTHEELLNLMPGTLPVVQQLPLIFSAGNRFADLSASSLSDGVRRQIDYPPKSTLSISDFFARS